MKTAIYSRKSVYSDTGESVENQVALCRTYLKEQFGVQEAREAEVYEDEGFSAKTMERPQLQRMLAEVQKGNIRRIICYRLDRISRNVCDFTALLERLERLGVEIICIREKFDTSTPMGKAMLYIASVFAQLERETISERVRDNMQLLAQMGRWLGGQAPYGYCSSKRKLETGEHRGKYACFLARDPAEWETAQLIFHIFSQCGNLQETAEQLRQKGKCSRTGIAFSNAALRAILSNPVYCRADAQSYAYFSQKGAVVCFEADMTGNQGILAYNKRDYRCSRGRKQQENTWVVAASRHEPLLSGEAWIQVQKLLLARPHRKPKNMQALCTGKLFCAACGGVMQPKRRNTGDTFDYICTSKMKYGAAACRGKNLPGRQADTSVMREIVRSLPWERYRLLLAAELDTNTEMQFVCEQIQSCRKKIERLLRGLEETALSRETQQQLYVRLQKLDAERQRLERNLLSGEDRKIQIDLLEIEAMPIDFQRRFVQRAVQQMQWDGTQLQIFLQ